MPQDQILGVDTVTAVTTMVQNVQLLISRTVSPFETAVLSITHLGCGLNLECNPKNQAILKEPFVPLIQCKETWRHILFPSFDTFRKSGSRCGFFDGVTLPVTFNDEELTKVVWEASQGLAEVIPANPSTAGEDFAFTKSGIPGVFAFIGSNGEPDAPDLHHDQMTIDDVAFEVSVPYYVENAQALLRYFKSQRSVIKKKLSPP